MGNNTDSNSISVGRLKLKDLFEKNLRIPEYQRPYEWKQEETRKLLEDIWNAKEKNEKHFIGNIIVEENGEYLDIIDGQQRFTTIYLISKLLGKNIFNFEYEIRDEVERFFEELKNILENNFKNKSENNLENNLNINKLINNLYELKKEEKYKNLSDIQRIIENLIEILKFCEEKGGEKYKEILKDLLKHIEFSITFLNGVDATKYFEVMNLRGKQLENHQVLKAKILEKISENERILYSQIWDYCSKFDNYTWELVRDRKSNSNLNNFLELVKKNNITSEDIKHLLKLEDEKFKENKDKDDVLKNLSENNQKEEEINILNIIKGNIPFENNKKILKEKEEKYSSIIKKYSIFLLHALRIYLAKEKESIKEAKNVPLDDLKLIGSFEKYLLNSEDKEKIENFLQFLLKLRILFDYFIFKRNKEDDSGEKVHLEAFGENKDKKNKLIIVELLFELTSGEEQNWLTAALGYLIRRFEKDKESNDYNKIAKNFYEFLEELDKAFMVRRLNEGKDFEDIIFGVFEKENENPMKIVSEEIKNAKKILETHEIKDENKDNNNNGKESKNNETYKVLNQGCNTPHYFFYKVEYLLWKNRENYLCDENLKNIYKNFENQKEDKKNIKNLISSFKLKKLNSIEHILPRSKAKNDEIVDIFGNLALISDSLNSRFSNEEFGEKKRIYLNKLRKENLESLKLLLVFGKYDKWDKGNIEDHHNEMIKLLLDDLKVNICEENK